MKKSIFFHILKNVQYSFYRGRYKVQRGGIFKVQRGGVYKLQSFENFSKKGRLLGTTEFLSILFGMYKQTLKFSDPNISKGFSKGFWCGTEGFSVWN